ncbi:MAG: ammonium transporter [Alphaproteobacteria bacterium]|nr:ammonium transporter [Alphaproteobacteria bacterium]
MSVNSGDTAWVLMATILVILMLLPGLGLFYGGMVRKKNVLTLLMQTISTAALVTVLWLCFGYSLAFTEGSGLTAGLIGGFSRSFLIGLTPSSISPMAPTIPETLFIMFQASFAMITPMILLGGPADRLKFSAAMIFVGVWTLLVYSPIVHMVWAPDGWLAGRGILDFAGGTVVHINAGVAGLVAALMVGKRRGLGSDAMAPHNLILTLLGAALLWVGWFGFNAGSAFTANGSAAYAMLTTHLAASAGLIGWCAVEWIQRGKPSLLGAVSGAISGLVVITPACGFVTVSSALILGLVAGPICYWGVSGLKRRFGYDDALDAFGIHGVGGILGALLTGVFAVAAIGGAGHSGLLDGNYQQLWVQFQAVAVTILWSGGASFVILKGIDLTLGLGVPL